MSAVGNKHSFSSRANYCKTLKECTGTKPQTADGTELCSVVGLMVTAYRIKILAAEEDFLIPT